MKTGSDTGAARAASPVRRALWYLETHLADAVVLEDVATVAGVSRFRLARTFLAMTGMPVMHYLRCRRLTEAARQLAGGAPDILAVALRWGYGSHEAFTRAFRSHFGTTPEHVRGERDAATLNLTEPFDVNDQPVVDLQAPRIVDSGRLRIAGLAERYAFDALGGIPALWERFVAQIAAIPNRVGEDTFGVCCSDDGDADLRYIAGVEVSRFDGVPAAFERIELPPRRYAVFIHRGHISDIRSTAHAIWSRGLQSAGLEPLDVPDFERYRDAFDPDTGYGEVEIWVAVAKSHADPARPD